MADQLFRADRQTDMKKLTVDFRNVFHNSYISEYILNTFLRSVWAGFIWLWIWLI